MSDEREIWVIAPKGFRPSNWVDMLRDFDVAFDLDPYLIDPGYVVGPGGHREEILVIRLELLDGSTAMIEETPEEHLRHALFWEMLERIGCLGLHISFPERMAREHPEAWTRTLEFCANNRITYTSRSA